MKNNFLKNLQSKSIKYYHFKTYRIHAFPHDTRYAPLTPTFVHTSVLFNPQTPTTNTRTPTFSPNYACT